MCICDLFVICLVILLTLVSFWKCECNQWGSVRFSAVFSGFKFVIFLNFVAN